MRACSALWTCGPGQPHSTPRCSPVLPSPHFFLTPSPTLFPFPASIFTVSLFPLPAPPSPRPTSLRLPFPSLSIFSVSLRSSQSPSVSLPLTPSLTPSYIHETGASLSSCSFFRFLHSTHLSTFLTESPANADVPHTPGGLHRAHVSGSQGGWPSQVEVPRATDREAQAWRGRALGQGHAGGGARVTIGSSFLAVPPLTLPCPDPDTPKGRGMHPTQGRLGRPPSHPAPEVFVARPRPCPLALAHSGLFSAPLGEFSPFPP